MRQAFPALAGPGPATGQPVARARRLGEALGNFARALTRGETVVGKESPAPALEAVKATGSPFVLASPLANREELDQLKACLGERMISCERQALGLALGPRVALLEAALDWSRSRMIIALSGGLLPTAAASTIVAGLRQLALGENLVAAKHEVEAAQLDAGDMLAIHLGLAALRPALGRYVGAAPDASWETIMPRLDPNRRELLAALAGRSPIVGLLEPALGDRRNEADLAEFLTNPAAQPIRDHVAAETAAALLDSDRQPDARAATTPADPSQILGRLQAVYLGIQGSSATLLVADILQAVIRDLCEACDRVGTEARPAGRPRFDFDTGGLDRARDRFMRWTFDLDQPRPALFFELLATTLVRAEALQSRELDRELRSRLRQARGGISRVLKRGLEDRPWPPLLRSPLRVFWLNLATAAFQLTPSLATVLETGSRAWDDLARVGCWVAADLRRDLDRLDAERATGRVSRNVSTLVLEDLDADEEVVVRRRLDFTGPGLERFRDALVVRRLIVRHSRRFAKKSDPAAVSSREVARSKAGLPEGYRWDLERLWDLAIS